MDRDHVQPIEEILAERLLRDRLDQIFVGRGDDPDVDSDGSGRPDAFELAVLEHAKKFYLQRQRKLADFIEEQRAVMRFFEQTFLVGPRVRIGALHVAEELVLDQVLRDRAAVLDDERFVGPFSRVVDGARNELLTGARLAVDDHGDVVLGDDRDLCQELFDF